MTTHRLAKETSPCLQQHAHNPVDWYAWGEEATGVTYAGVGRTGFAAVLSFDDAATRWFATMMMALQEALVATRTVLLRGTPAELTDWQAELNSRFRRGMLVLDAALKDLSPVFDKPANDSVNAYVREGVTCPEPVDE